ncbi:MAG TPA: MarR family transcriptional regulator [Trebonia sp.]|jgi:DNA-binding MarR family transcriptional regulator|nr:MarR family transcriptional regulator [Trebonia sp.]
MTTSAAETGLRDHDEAVKAAWHALISAKVASWHALERDLGELHGLGVSDFEVLDQLAGKPDGCRAQNMADAVHLSQSALSRLADRLERHGLVQRCNCTDDRRGINLVLTPAGRDKHAQALRTYCEVLAGTLPPELIARFE